MRHVIGRAQLMTPVADEFGFGAVRRFGGVAGGAECFLASFRRVASRAMIHETGAVGQTRQRDFRQKRVSVARTRQPSYASRPWEAVGEQSLGDAVRAPSGRKKIPYARPWPPSRCSQAFVRPRRLHRRMLPWALSVQSCDSRALSMVSAAVLRLSRNGHPSNERVDGLLASSVARGEKVCRYSGLKAPATSPHSFARETVHRRLNVSATDRLGAVAQHAQGRRDPRIAHDTQLALMMIRDARRRA